LQHPYSELAQKLELRGLFDELNDQVLYMDKIVSDLQDYARDLGAKLVESSLSRLMDETLSMIEVPSTVKISKTIDKDFPTLTVDPVLMMRVFSNLIRNAIQAMPDGGQLGIRASITAEAFLISIQDSGTGIPQENLDKIWRPLFTTKAKGTGLGLPVCKRLVEAHAGEITVESEVNKGSTFTVKLPLKKEVM